MVYIMIKYLLNILLIISTLLFNGSALSVIDEPAQGTQGGKTQLQVKLNFADPAVGDEIQKKYMDIYNQIVKCKMTTANLANAMKAVVDFMLSANPELLKAKTPQINNFMRSMIHFIKNPSDLVSDEPNVVNARNLLFDRLQVTLKTQPENLIERSE